MLSIRAWDGFHDARARAFDASSWQARPATVGYSNSHRRGTSRSSWLRMREITDRSEQRVPAKLEEIVVYADSFQT